MGIELPLKKMKVKKGTKCVEESFSVMLLFLLGKNAKHCI